LTDREELSTGTNAELGDYTEFGPARSFARRVWLRVVVLVVLALMLVSSFAFRGWGTEATLFSVAFATAALVFVAFDLAPASRRLQVGQKGFRVMPDGWFVPWGQVDAVSAVAANQVTWVRVTFVPEDGDPKLAGKSAAKPERVRIWLPASTPNPMDLMVLRLGESADREG
jgi:hypothetical protein